VNYQEVINIASKFDAKGFKQAETALGKLNGTAKKLAGSFGLAFGAAAITQYGKAAVKAFAEDEAAATRLTRAVDNLGIGFANPAITDYIAELEKSAAIADDVLRPAFQSLLTTTGSLTQSQKLLNDAIIISRASGIDLATVSEDLAKGYVGITKGLVKYNTGLTKAEIQSKSFSEILGVLLTQSAGAASDYLGTTAYSMDVLSIATGNASEIIGKGLVDAFARVGGGTEASDAAIAIENIAKALAGVTIATGTVIGGVTNVFKTLKNLPKNIFQGFAGAQTGVNLGKTSTPTPQLSPTEKQRNAALGKLEADAAARAKKLAALQKTATKAQQDSLKLAKARAIFDLQKIQIEAALKGKISEEDAIRLKLMKAIEEENLTNIEKYQKALEVAQTKTKELNELLGTVKAMEIADPFGMWKIDPLTASINELTKSMFSVQTQIQANGKEWSSFASTVATTIIRPNLSEWNSAFTAAASAAKGAFDSLNGTTTGGSTTGGTTTGGSTTGGTTTDALAKSATDAIVAKADAAAAAAAAAAKAAAAKIEALQKQADAAAALLESSNASAQRNAVVAAAAAQAALEAALKALEDANAKAAAAAVAAAAAATNSKIEVIVDAPPLTDPNALAEAIAEVLRQAQNRGTLDLQAIA
jgi:hypothetical protein